MENLRNYKCVACGADIFFKPELQKWKCDYCQSIFEKADLETHLQEEEERERKRREALGLSQSTRAEIQEELDTYHCENCGAEIIGENDTVATFCLYCKSPTIIKARMQGEFDPRFVIPFKIPQKEIESRFSKWIHSFFLAPGSFKRESVIKNIRGVYAPVWLFWSKNTQFHFRGTGTRVRVWRSGKTEYTEESFFKVEREGTVSYQNIPIDGSTKLDNEAMSKIEPFDFKEMIPFSMDYMTGFFAERYDETKEDVKERAENRLLEYVKTAVNETISYDSYKDEAEEVKFGEVDADYSMLPIYILTNEYRGEKIQYLVNGQTGKIFGKVPIDKLKATLFTAGVFSALWIAISAVFTLLR